MDKSRINELLQERGLTMQDLAKAMNISTKRCTFHRQRIQRYHA